MDTWLDLARQNQTSAWELSARRRWRSAISRAYYAIYSLAASALSSCVTWPLGREGPSHRKLPEFLATHIIKLSSVSRRDLADAVTAAYKLRVVADYVPTTEVNQNEAKTALGLMYKVFSLLEKCK